MTGVGFGCVINVVSDAGRTGNHYFAAKHADHGMRRTLDREFATKSVTVNAVCPGSASISGQRIVIADGEVM
jgi:NAD(P)-dependent dehydrogenase (short-subunit alcohol dehydrogenase family)